MWQTAAATGMSGRMMAAAPLALLAVLFAGGHHALAQVPGGPGNGGGHHDDPRGDEGPVCEPGVQNPQCGSVERCCVRVKEVRRMKVDGRWRTRVVLGGWRCFTGPNADRMCRRYNRE